MGARTVTLEAPPRSSTIMSSQAVKGRLALAVLTVFLLTWSLAVPSAAQSTTPIEAILVEGNQFLTDEAFLTSTSYCVLPLSRFNGQRIGGEIPGPVTKRLLDAWSEMVGVDIVAQAVRHIN